jgi:hypothetical protein
MHSSRVLGVLPLLTLYAEARPGRCFKGRLDQLLAARTDTACAAPLIRDAGRAMATHSFTAGMIPMVIPP